MLDAHRSVPFEYRREETHPVPTNNGAANSTWTGTIGEMVTSLQEINWITPDIRKNPIIAVFCFTGCAIGIALMATVALLTSSPFVFPSLGPTAFLFFSNPTAPAASPRNTIIGHTIGVLVGYFSLAVTGLTTAGPALQVGVTTPRIIAIALSLSLTGGLMVLFRVLHPPAGATTLIVSLGTFAKPWQLGVLMGAVVLLTLFAILFNRLVGIPHPLWRKTGSHEVDSKITVESDLWVCSTGIAREEGSSDPKLSSSEMYNLTSSSAPTAYNVSKEPFSKREGLSRIKRTHVRLIPLNAHTAQHVGSNGPTQLMF